MTMEEVNGKIDKNYDRENVSNYWGLSKYFSIDIKGGWKIARFDSNKFFLFAADVAIFNRAKNIFCW